ncbi:MAG: CAP domain-containing protein, partial [Lachnospiraceae bacterium]|nr:CAP domain-containing protein [Lachnospiraceae bacterium]
NEERKRLGLNELVIDETMMTAAETRAKEQKTLFSHTRPDGTSCFTVFDQFEIPANYRGENLASGGKCTPDFVMKMWIASEGHYKNIKHEKFTRIGVGYFESGKYGYWAQLFAN